MVELGAEQGAELGAELGVHLVDLDFTRSFTRHLAAPQEGTLLPSFRPQAVPKEGIPVNIHLVLIEGVHQVE